MTPLSQLLDDRAVDLSLPKGRKPAIIAHLAGLAAATGAVTDRDALERELLQREEEISTATGAGIAIPHKLSPHVNRRILGFARCAGGVAFDAPDRKPVELFFLLLAPEAAVTEHLRILSRLARYLHDGEFKQRLLSAENADALRSAFLSKETE